MVKTVTGGKVWDGNGWTSLIDDPEATQPYPPKSKSWTDPKTTLFIGARKPLRP